MKEAVSSTLNDATFMKGKDVVQLTGCGINEAWKIINDIKEEYNLKRVMYCHIKKYFSIP
jgi:hypothetical protein